MARDSTNQPVGAPMAPPLAEAYVEITHESRASGPFPSYTNFICIRTEADCAISFGENPVADPEYHHIEPGERLFYGVHAGHRVAVIGLAPELLPEVEETSPVMEETHASDDEHTPPAESN